MLFIKKFIKKPLTNTALYILEDQDLCNYLSLNLHITTNFFQELEKNYFENPYHNSTHAADVFSSFWYLCNNSVLIEHMTKLEILSGLIACLAHDVSHPGFNNNFVINS